MRQRPFPPGHGGENLFGKTLPRSRTATLRSPRKYEQLVWVNRALRLLADIYEHAHRRLSWVGLGQRPICPASSTGRCNTVQCVDSTMLLRKNPSVWLYCVKT